MHPNSLLPSRASELTHNAYSSSPPSSLPLIPDNSFPPSQEKCHPTLTKSVASSTNTPFYSFPPSFQHTFSHSHPSTPSFLPSLNPSLPPTYILSLTPFYSLLPPSLPPTYTLSLPLAILLPCKLSPRQSSGVARASATDTARPPPLAEGAVTSAARDKGTGRQYPHSTSSHRNAKEMKER